MSTATRCRLLAQQRRTWSGPSSGLDDREVRNTMSTDAPAPTFRLRAATKEDLDAVFSVVASSDMREFGEIDTPKEEFAVDWAEMDHGNNVRLAVEPDGRVVGYANCTGERQFSGIDAEGYVHADHEGRGIGTALIRWTEQRAADFVALAPEG